MHFAQQVDKKTSISQNGPPVTALVLFFSESGFLPRFNSGEVAALTALFILFHSIYSCLVPELTE